MRSLGNTSFFMRIAYRESCSYTKKTLTDWFILLPFNIWEGKINATVYLPHRKGPSWLEEKKCFWTSDKILQLTNKCETKLKKTQKYIIVLFSTSSFIPLDSLVYSFSASGSDLIELPPLSLFFIVISHLAKEQRNWTKLLICK